jgi:hypothetical protein
LELFLPCFFRTWRKTVRRTISFGYRSRRLWSEDVIVAAAKTQTDSRRSKKRSRGIEELLLLVSKKCKREDGTVDLEERAAMLASAASKAVPGFAEALTAQRMIRICRRVWRANRGAKLHGASGER